jgi:alkylation response protein AidB-like acyl-CoA dehydrogenase
MIATQAVENFDQLSEPTAGADCANGAVLSAGALDAARIIGIFGKADPSTALVLSMHYIQHLVMARSTRWPGRLARKLARETVEGVALINALRVEPDLGSPSRGGLPATIARKTETGWRLSGRKVYSTERDPEMVRWARTRSRPGASACFSFRRDCRGRNVETGTISDQRQRQPWTSCSMTSFPA